MLSAWEELSGTGDCSSARDYPWRQPSSVSIAPSDRFAKALEVPSTTLPSQGFTVSRTKEGS